LSDQEYPLFTHFILSNIAVEQTEQFFELTNLHGDLIKF